MDEIDIEKQLAELWKSLETYSPNDNKPNPAIQLCSELWKNRQHYESEPIRKLWHDLQDYLHKKIKDVEIRRMVRTNLDDFYLYMDLRHRKETNSDEAAMNEVRTRKPALSAFLDAKLS